MSCKGEAEDTSGNRKQIVTMLDSWNKAAAEADFNAYFKYFTEDAVFIGTDATENWNKKRFMIWAKPFFDRGKAWNFTSLDRNIYFNTSGKMAWFDELLSTQMKICRGSGVIVKEGSDWKIQQYVLSMTIPNELSDSVVKIKGAVEDALIEKISEK
ncbi:MAG: nuclear transport factor 2 family protein [Ferruginibacter sp.]|nr:nuclear transport factor 2 family protein [Ferruginibacter sp.]